MPGNFAPTESFEPSLNVKEQILFNALVPVRKQLLLVAGYLLQRFEDSLCVGPGDDSATGQHDGVRPVDLNQGPKKVANRMFEIGFENGLKIGRMGKAGRRGTRHVFREEYAAQADIIAASKLEILEETQASRKLVVRTGLLTVQVQSPRLEFHLNHFC